MVVRWGCDKKIKMITIPDSKLTFQYLWEACLKEPSSYWTAEGHLKTKTGGSGWWFWYLYSNIYINHLLMIFNGNNLSNHLCVMKSNCRLSLHSQESAFEFNSDMQHSWVHFFSAKRSFDPWGFLHNRKCSNLLLSLSYFSFTTVDDGKLQNDRKS